MDSENEKGHSVDQSGDVPGAVNDERRDALRLIGKFGAYTAPALLAMLASEKAAAVT